MNQILFLCGLYLTGVAAGLLLKKHIPVVFLAFSGFMWGSLFYVIAAVICLVSGIGYSIRNMLVIWVLGLVVIAFLHYRKSTWRITLSETAIVVGTFCGFGLVMVASGFFNFTKVSNDSFNYLMWGRTMAYTGRLGIEVAHVIGNYGIWVPAMQSASVFLGEDYLYMLYPTLALSFLSIFGYLCFRVVHPFFSKIRYVIILVVLACLLLVSTDIISFQFFYLHSTFPAAVYLIVAVASFWLADCEKNQAWLVFAVLGLLGFCLTRIESPLFSLIYLALVVSRAGYSYRVRLTLTLSFLLPVIVWYLVIGVSTIYGVKYLNPTNTLGMVGLMAAFGLLVGLTGIRKLERWILAYLPVSMFLVILAGVGLMFILKSEHMLISLDSMLQNTFMTGRWGATWYVLVILLVLAIWQPPVHFEGLFAWSIPIFVLLLLALVFVRNPYHLRWTDSANRMLTHLAPVVLLYLMIKYSPMLEKWLERR